MREYLFVSVVLEEKPRTKSIFISAVVLPSRRHEPEANTSGSDHISRNASRAYCRRLNCAWIMAESFRICTTPSRIDWASPSVGACNHSSIDSNAFHPSAIQVNFSFDDDQSEEGKASRHRKISIDHKNALAAGV